MALSSGAASQAWAEVEDPWKAELESIYLSPAEALEAVFGPGARVEKTSRLLSAEDKAAMEKRLGRRLREEGFEVHRGFKGDVFLGDAVITEEIGKFKYITFIVMVKPDGSLGEAAVMTYRESRGGEVRRPRFLRQFKGKKATSPLALNRDILNVAGATMSVRAMAAGVKKVLVFITEVYRPALESPPSAP